MNDKIPIAEVFHSLQGEGVWTGTPMFFVRTAGCTVGKAHADDPEVDTLHHPVLKTLKPAWQCHTYDGRPFWCDTDFHKYHEYTIGELLEMTYEHHICLTGGEPLMHMKHVKDLWSQATKAGRHLHIETSGTIAWQAPPSIWITVSPKAGVLESMIDRANEIKVLVDDDFDADKLPWNVFGKKNVFLQPINNELTINDDNMQRVLELLKTFPQWRLSAQLHKYLKVR